MKEIFGAALLILAAIIGLTVLLGSWYTIDAGERGVILRNGAVSGVAQPGLGFKVPLIDDVVGISVQTKKIEWEKVAAYSKDQQPAEMKVSVNYRLSADKVAEIYTQFGSEDGVVERLIAPRVQEELKTIFGGFNAERAIRERSDLNSQVQSAIAEAVKGPVTIEGVQIENIDFSDAFEQAVEQRAQAEVEVAKFRQNAEREKVTAEITVTQANAAADSVRAKALAEAEAIKLRGDAEAAAVEAKGRALRDNPNLVNLIQAERWNGQLPTTMLPNGSVPMLSVQSQPRTN